MKQYKWILALAVAVFFTAPAFASAEKPVALPVELKAAGDMQNMPLLQLEFKSGSKPAYLVTITDENGIVLYSEKLSTAKQFLLNTDDLGNAVLQFDITDTQAHKTVSYRVSTAATALRKAQVEKL